MDLTRAKNYITNRLINDLPEELYYHGVHHTFAVVNAIRKLAISEKVNNRSDYNILLTAAYYHDSGFLFQYDNNEIFATNLVSEVLPNFDYSDVEINKINKIILATQSHITPSSLLEKIMCDADHDYIGTTDYHRIAKTLRNELKTQNIIYNDIEWIEVQYKYLTTKHKYYTKTAIRNRVPQKNKIIEELFCKLENFKSDIY